MSETISELTAISSGEFVPDKPTISADEAVQAGRVTEAAAEANSRASEILARPELPDLERKNRARLQMQSPGRLYFYWTIGPDPYKILEKAVPGATNYTLVVRLVDVARDAEEIHRVEADGNWWFNVAPDSEYRADVGFYAPNRPFVRILASNTIATPRRSPSPRAADDAQWRVPAENFARVLEAAGFEEDAFDVSTEERHAADAFSLLTGRPPDEDADLDTDAVWQALRAISEGAMLESLRFTTTPEVFAILQARIDKLDIEAIKNAVDNQYADEEYETLPGVVGLSLIHFPRRRRMKRGGPQPISSTARRISS